MAIDPICGMEIDEKTARLKEKYEDKTYYFCNEIDRQTFLSAPQKYAR